MIEVHQTDEETYSVRILADKNSEHTVTLEEDYYRELTSGDILPEELIQNAIHFLLERKGAEEIMGDFDLSYLQRLFPDFEKSMKRQSSVGFV